MSFMPFCDRGLAAAVQVPTTALIKRGSGGGFSGLIRLPTDPVGTITATFVGVPAGIEIRVYDTNRNELAGVETCDADHVLSWPVYASGSPNNTVRIVIISVEYKLKDFTYTSVVGNQSIPVQIEPDPWNFNP